MTLAECIDICASTPEFVREFDRLAGAHLSSIGTRAPLDTLIDEATGRDKDAFRQFVAFVAEFIWLPLTDGGER